MPIPTSTPSPAEVVKQATQIINTWNDLGPLMAVLLVAALALLIVLLISWGTRNTNATVITVLANLNTQKDKDIADLKAQREAEHEQFIASLGELHEQAIRQNDIQTKQAEILKTQTERDTARDLKTDQLAADVKQWAERGGQHAQEILASAQRNAETLQRIDTRTTNWDTVVQIITPILQELQAVLLEAKKHSTKPIPAVETNGLTTEP